MDLDLDFACTGGVETFGLDLERDRDLDSDADLDLDLQGERGLELERDRDLVCERDLDLLYRDQLRDRERLLLLDLLYRRLLGLKLNKAITRRSPTNST